MNELLNIASDLSNDVGIHISEIDSIDNDISRAQENEDLSIQHLKQVMTRIGESNQNMKTELAVSLETIKEQSLQIESYVNDALSDSLTGLANSRAFDFEMDRSFSGWERYHTPFSLIILDVDHFKKFNDRYGHQGGDDVLKGVSKVMKKSMRSADLVARYGGE